MIRQLLLLAIFTILPLFAKLHCVASIPPIKSFVEAIGDGEVQVSVMVQPGNSPHSYEPKPSQMKALDQAECYFAIGVEFERAWLPRFASQNPRMRIVDLSKGIEKLPMEHSKDHGHGEEGSDPHIWTSTTNVRKMAERIYHTLASLDPQHEALYKKRLLHFLKKIDETDAAIRKKLSTLPPHSAFMVFHPSWGYFAHEYGLRQLPVEVEGKAPKPRQLMKLIDEARKLKVRSIFTQPEFSDKSAQLLARELNIPVIKVSPLAEDWSENLLKLADAISAKRTQ